MSLLVVGASLLASVVLASLGHPLSTVAGAGVLAVGASLGIGLNGLALLVGTGCGLATYSAAMNAVGHESIVVTYAAALAGAGWFGSYRPSLRKASLFCLAMISAAALVHWLSGIVLYLSVAGLALIYMLVGHLQRSKA